MSQQKQSHPDANLHPEATGLAKKTVEVMRPFQRDDVRTKAVQKVRCRIVAAGVVNASHS